MSINFYGKKPFLGNSYPSITDGLTIWRLSSEIRGVQMAEYLGSKFNQERAEGDVCIFLKPSSLDKVKDGDYVDYNDPDAPNNLEEKLRQRPLIKVIANCQNSYEYLSKRLENELFCIPQQHINWDNEINPKRGMLVGGYIGRPSNTSFTINSEIKNLLKEKLNIDFNICYKWTTRQEAVDFYKGIDFLVMAGEGISRYDSPFTTPTKMINAASFRIPTFAFRKQGYKEFEDYYIPYTGNEELLNVVNNFKDKDYYNSFSSKILEKAQQYHISKIAEMYKQLK